MHRNLVVTCLRSPQDSIKNRNNNTHKANQQKNVQQAPDYCFNHSHKYTHEQHATNVKNPHNIPLDFNGKTEKFELFDNLFGKNIMMYPHTTEIQKINFHTLLRE